LLDLLFELGDLVLAVLALAELLLDRLHLLVEVVLALRLLHLALDARADALLDLQHADLASISPSTFSSRSVTIERSPAVACLSGIFRQMRGDRVGELAGSSICVQRRQHLGRHLLVELDIAARTALTTERASASASIASPVEESGTRSGVGLEIILGRGGEAAHRRARGALDQHLHGAVGQLQQLQHVASVPTRRCRRSPDRRRRRSSASTSRICLSSFITSSSARIDFSRPTNSGTIMCGKTTMSRSGSRRLRGRQVEHGVEQDALHDRAQAARAGLAVDRLAAIGAERLVGQGELHVLHLEQPLILLDQRVLRLGQDAISASRRDRRASRPPAGGRRIPGSGRISAGPPARPRGRSSPVRARRRRAPRRRSRSRCPCRAPNDLLEAGEGAAADEQDVGGVDLQEFLLRMLAAALRRHEATVPSMIFSSACCTPSPDTSRVIEGLSDLRLILSISSI
jgi:hypothetical protein